MVFVFDFQGNSHRFYQHKSSMKNLQQLPPSQGLWLKKAPVLHAMGRKKRKWRKDGAPGFQFLEWCFPFLMFYFPGFGPGKSLKIGKQFTVKYVPCKSSRPLKKESTLELLIINPYNNDGLFGKTICLMVFGPPWCITAPQN